MTLHGENFSTFFEESAESVEVRLCAVTQIHKHSKCEQCFHTNSHTYILQIYAKKKKKIFDCIQYAVSFHNKKGTKQKSFLSGKK